MAGDEYIRLVAAYQSTAGYRIYWQIHSVVMSHGIFMGNHSELHERVNQFANPDVASRLFNQARHTESQAELHELVRLLHNYVAAVSTLVDHTRLIARKLLDTKSYAVYQQRVDSEFKDDSTSQFLRGLRNFLLHVSHPPIRATLRLDNGAGMASEISLASGELLKWDNWSPKSLEYIKARASGIPLLPLVDEYERKVQAFYKWLVDYFYDACYSDMREFWSRQNEWAAFCRNHGIPITELEFAKFSGQRT